MISELDDLDDDVGWEVDEHPETVTQLSHAVDGVIHYYKYAGNPDAPKHPYYPVLGIASIVAKAEAAALAEMLELRGYDSTVVLELRGAVDHAPHDIEKYWRPVQILLDRIAIKESNLRKIVDNEAVNEESVELPTDMTIPPKGITGCLGPKLAQVFAELWTHGSLELGDLENRCWKKPVQPATVHQTIKRLRKKLADEPYQINIRNNVATLER